MNNHPVCQYHPSERVVIVDFDGGFYLSYKYEARFYRSSPSRPFDYRDLFVDKPVDLTVERGAFAFIEVLVALLSCCGLREIHFAHPARADR